MSNTTQYILVNEVTKERFALDKQVTTIGRSKTSDLVIDYHYISRLHALVVRLEDGIFLVDCNSANGTCVNQHLTKFSKLQPGDVLNFGLVRFRVEDPIYRFAAGNLADNLRHMKPVWQAAK